MKIVNLESVPAAKVDMEGAQNAYKQLVLSRNDGAPTFSFRVFTVNPGGHTPYHEHASEHLNYIMQGQGVLVDAAGTEHGIKKGNFALVRPNEKHQYKNTSKDEPLVLICAVPKEYE